MRDRDVLETVEVPVAIPHNFVINYDIDGNDVWVATAKGLGWGIGTGYYPGLKERPKTLAKAAGRRAMKLQMLRSRNSSLVRRGFRRSTVEAAAKPRRHQAMPPELKALIDPDTAEVLKRINGLSPYQTPDLRLRQDTSICQHACGL